MKIQKKITALLASLFLSAQAGAIQISSGDSWTVDWLVDASVNPRLTQNLSATSSWLVSSYSSTRIILDVTITNTTLLAGLLSNADITSFGFGTGPDVRATPILAGSTFTMTGAGHGPNQTFPGGFKGIDVCIFFHECAGGSAPSGLRAGESDKLQLLLTGSFGSTTELLYFPLKFQTNRGSYEPGGCVNCSSNAPEPSILVLLGIGLALIGFAHQCRKRRA
jgi:hypothetical protein